MAVPLVTPVLFLIFRQPEVTRRVFEQIRAARPRKLYIAADGPRANRPDDITDCEATRAVVANIDWSCEVHTRFQTANLGLKRAVSSALDWFFEAEEEGIVLEYDCLPDPTFFGFAEEMLSRYRGDNRIFSITGTNIQPEKKYGDGDYYFSRFTPVWGWASWRRSWRHWRPYLADYDLFKKEGRLSAVVVGKAAQAFWQRTFDSVHSGENTTTWAFCFVYAQIKEGGLCVVPRTNLVANLGFGPEGTNAIDPQHPLSKLDCQSLDGRIAPKFILPSMDADEEFSIRCAYVRKEMLFTRILSRILKMQAKF
jgi:hypothetical protein